MSLAMEEFYSNMRSVGISAVTGQGCEDFFKAVDEAAVEFHTEYVPYLQEQRRDMEEKRKKAVEEQVADFKRGLDKARAKRRFEDDGEGLDGLEATMRDVSIGETPSRASAA